MKKQCKTCSKRRDLKFYDTPRSLNCQMCKISIAHGQKKARKEAGVEVWIKRLDDHIRPQVRGRVGDCESPRPHNCNHNWQWCHGISRSYHSTRWLLNNGFKMCNAEHKYFTHHPLEWDDFLYNYWGETEYWIMKRLALTPITDKTYYKELYKQLKESI